MGRKFSDVSLSYVRNAYNLDLARREFEKQALAMIEQVVSDLSNIARKQLQDADCCRWREPISEAPQREIAWLNFKTNAFITIDVKPKGFRNFKKEAAYLFFEILFDSERREFVFQCRFENQSVHEGLDDLDEKIIELARAPDAKAKYPDSNHIKASTAIIYKYRIDDELFENLSPRIKDAVELCEAALIRLSPMTDSVGSI